MSTFLYRAPLAILVVEQRLFYNYQNKDLLDLATANSDISAI
jgi:hypothetical protein